MEFSGSSRVRKIASGTSHHPVCHRWCGRDGIVKRKSLGFVVTRKFYYRLDEVLRVRVRPNVPPRKHNIRVLISSQE